MTEGILNIYSSWVTMDGGLVCIGVCNRYCKYSDDYVSKGVGFGPVISKPGRILSSIFWGFSVVMYIRSPLHFYEMQKTLMFIIVINIKSHGSKLFALYFIE